MKANFQHLGFEQVETSFLCYWVKSPLFGFHWHYHPELEITYVHRGMGIRLVGNHVSEFQEGDFVFLGSNLPHTWISDDDFNASSENMEVVVLQFPIELFAQPWLSLPEMGNIRKLFQLADRGISFSPGIREAAAQILLGMPDQDGFERFQSLLSLLHLLGKDEAPSLLASKGFTPSLQVKSEKRILTVCQYIHNHFTEPISLDKMAEMAHMNPASFCRFFKKMTGQTLIEYVNDLKIGKACNLLISDQNKSIADIAFIAGFNSQTLFNRKFLKKKGMTPGAFRKTFN